MRDGSQYDLIVLGAGLSGLMAAALMARRGRRVLVLEEGAAPGGASCRIVRDGFSYIRGPALFLGFEQDGLYDRVFIELGLSLSLLKQNRNLFQRSTPPFQIILPGHRINFYVDSAELLDELVREFPDQIEGVRSFLKEVDHWNEILLPPYHRIRQPVPKGIRERLFYLQKHIQWRSALRALRRESAAALLKRFRLDEEFCRGLELLLLAFTDVAMDGATGLDLMLLMGLLRREVVSIHGGIPRLAEVLVKIIQEHQGSVISSKSLEELVVQRKTLTAIRTGGEEIEVVGDCILNLPEGQLPVAGRTRRFMSFYFGVDSQALPPPMKEHVLMTQDLKRAPMGENFLFLTMSGRDDGQAAPQGRRALQVITRLEKSDEPTPAEIEKLSKAVTKHLTDLMPFSSRSLTFVGHDLWNHRSDSLPLGAAMPLLNRLRNRGRDGTAYYTLPVKNLFLLPDGGDHPASHLWQARSALELAEYLLERD